jgi:hypothetical protein
LGQSDFYQLLLKCGGDRLWDAIPHFLAEPNHKIRRAAL